MRVKHSQKMSFVLTFKNLIADIYIPFILMMKQWGEFCIGLNIMVHQTIEA